jgi:hypothetical protein
VYFDTGWNDIPLDAVENLLSVPRFDGLLSDYAPKFMEARDVLTWLTWTDYCPIDLVSDIWLCVSRPTIVFRGFLTFSDEKEFIWMFPLAGLYMPLSFEADGDLAKLITDDWFLLAPI